MEYNSSSSEETQQIGATIASTLRGGDIVLLQGELGAGKTTLTKGIAAGLGVKDEITSPTFTLMNVYDIPTLQHSNTTTLIHIDTYRLENAQEMLDIGVEDYLGASDTVCLIEWPEKIQELLKNKKVIKVHLDHAEAGKRKILLEKF